MGRRKQELKKQSISDVPNAIERGWLGLNYSGSRNYGNITEDKRADFIFPKSIATFQYMAQDPVIAAANNIINIMINKVEWKFEVADNATAKEKSANDFLNWCMGNMDHTWKSFINEVGSYRIYGFHIAEKVFKEAKEGKYKGKLHWKKLPTRAQSTIQGWVFDENIREFKGAKQSINGLTNIYSIETDATGLIGLPASKILMFTYQGTKGNPEGHSPLKDCYQPWTYKKTVESYEAISVAKDLGGIPVMGIDAAFLAKAQADPGSSEGLTLTSLQTAMENLHAGEQTYMILPVAYTDSGKELFTFDLIGVKGSGGKNYSTREIVNGKQLEILMIYLADVLTLGNTSHGSFALAESKNSLLAFGIENHLSFIKDVIQTQLVPETLAYNGWGDIPKEKMPKLVHTSLDEQSSEELSKLVQRIAAVNFLPRSKELVNEILEKGGFKYRLQDGDVLKDKECEADILYDEIFTGNETGAGEGLESGMPNGVGSGNKNNSDTNLDNKG